MAEVILYLICSLGIALPVIIIGLKSFQRSSGIHIGLGLYILFSVIMHIMIPIWQFFSDYYRYSATGYSIWSHTQALGIYALSICSVMFAYLFTMQADRRRLAFGAHFSAKAKLNWNWHAIAVVATFVIAIPAFMVAAYLTTRIGAVGLDAYFRNRIYYRSDLGAIAVLTKTMPVYAALLVMAVRSCAGRRRVLWSVALALSTIVWAAYSAATGIRFEIFSWLAAAIITALFVAGPEVGRVVRRLVVPTLVLGVLLSLAGEARRAFVSGDTGETFSRSLLRGVNGAFGNHENVVWLVESKPELTHGSNLASMVTALVPRAIWPDKPTGGGPILTNIIYPDSYYVGGWGVSSLTTGLLTEFYMAFGWLGVLIGSLIIGYLLYIVRRAFLAGQNRMIVSISLIATVYIAIFSQFSELSQMSLQVILSITVLVACYMLAVGPHARAPTVSGRRVS